jgi:hypothetical protein
VPDHEENSMKYVRIAVELMVSENATDEDVRAAVQDCVLNALPTYAKASNPMPHWRTGAPVYWFRCAEAVAEILPY